ncbi:uncharacterized protein KY384_001771 [Bacidia gigantensis]|uniref:uncharacterized protein n=1 Tax=Bacidia gigantensis TaxID=2732470 RepID=UPI001D04D993|nr:uncharacterized protein KY384_001771 [Bacidia gigantensis]KAG8532989.1 hypothetical protein KY384_001771 [Bacidia gigantensis]
MEGLPLNSERREIRILRPLDFQAADPMIEDSRLADSRPQFELEVVSLDDRPTYTALSYVWGTQSEGLKPVIINGCQFDIGGNLFAALQNIPIADMAPAIWIDAICINQADEIEKTKQVQLMRSIYSGAQGVIVWLGLPTEKSDFIVDFVDKFVEHLKRDLDIPTPHDEELVDYIDFEEANGDVLKHITMAVQSLTPADDPAKHAALEIEVLKDFLHFITGREYWYRIWVLQEFVLACQTQMYIGSRQLDSQGLAALLACVTMAKIHFVVKDSIRESLVKSLSSHGSETEWLLYMYTCRERFDRRLAKPAAFRVFDLLCTIYCRPVWHQNGLGGLKTSDRRDQIFGLVGLCEEDFSKTLGMSIDYHQSWEEVYINVAERLISSGYLDILALCQLEMPSELPSWTPSWHEMIGNPNWWFKTGYKGSAHSLLGNSLFTSSSNSTVDVSFVTFQSGSSRSRSMQIKGISVDKIMTVKSMYLRSGTKTFMHKEIVYGKLLREIEQLCRQSKDMQFNTYTAEKLLEAPWRIPIWDCEGPSTYKDDGRTQRATSAYSRSRYKTCLPLFRAMEEWLDSRGESESAISQDQWASHPINILEPQLGPEANTYLIACRIGSPMRPFITTRGYIGLGSANIQAGDTVCVFYGANVPHVLRRREHDKPGYTFIGESFVYGLMDGEAMEQDHESMTFEVF